MDLARGSGSALCFTDIGGDNWLGRGEGGGGAGFLPLFGFKELHKKNRVTLFHVCGA